VPSPLPAGGSSAASVEGRPEQAGRSVFAGDGPDVVLDFPGETFRVFRDGRRYRFGGYRTRMPVLEAWEGLT